MQQRRVGGGWRSGPALLVLGGVAGLGLADGPGGNTIAIAPVDEALTFARVESERGPRALLVVRYENGNVEGVDLSTAFGGEVSDPVSAYREHGYAALSALVARTPVAARAIVRATDLTIPVDLGSHHVAAGTNYPEHAGEAGVEDGPFLFAKLVTPTDARAPVAVGGGLLDYEVELAFVALDTIRTGAPPTEMGMILCNDYTDRETLLRHVDVWDVSSGQGFTTGKSFPGYLPVGDLFVIPRDYRDFAAKLELQLYVNDTLRQQSMVSAHVWGIDQLLGETWKRRGQRWQHRDGQVALLPDENVIEPGTLIMAGTPAGTVFQNVGLLHRLKGAVRWALGGFNGPIAKHVIDSYVSAPGVRGGYLQPGDRVTIRVEFLGVIDNEIVP